MVINYGIHRNDTLGKELEESNIKHSKNCIMFNGVHNVGYYNCKTTT